MDNLIIYVIVANLSNLVTVNDEYLVSEVKKDYGDFNKTVSILNRNTGDLLIWNENSDSLIEKKILIDSQNYWTSQKQMGKIEFKHQIDDFIGKEANLYHAYFTSVNPLDSAEEVDFYKIVVSDIPDLFRKYNITEDELSVIFMSGNTYVLKSLMNRGKFEPLIEPNFKYSEFYIRKLDYVKEIYNGIENYRFILDRAGWE